MSSLFYQKQAVTRLLGQVIATLQSEGILPEGITIQPAVERPAQPEHGDFATSLAMQLAKAARQPPRVLAEKIVSRLQAQTEYFSQVEVAGPGFINLHLQPQLRWREIAAIRTAGDAYGQADWGAGRRLLLEFVSANPTGPLNIVSARAASVGDALARLLKSQGVEVHKEYYVNDAGNQALLLGESLLARYLQAQGIPAEIPEEGYQGEYVKTLAQEIAAKCQAQIEQARQSEAPAGGPSELVKLFKNEGIKKIVAWQKRDLEDIGCVFDQWFSELDLHQSGKVADALEDLKSRGYIFEKDGATWFRSTDFGDDKDRVLIKADGLPAYIAADVAYHRDKFERGFTELVDIWGPDHHGYIPRMKAAMQALGHPADAFRVLIAQQVNLLENGQPMVMSKRAGIFVTMADLIKEVGRDVTRFFFLMRSTDAHLDFDLDLARKHTEENPVFYVQYAHARICSILKKGVGEGLVPPPAGTALSAQAQELPEEVAVLRALAAFPEIVEACARNLEPHGLAFYLRDLATVFHRYYAVCRVVDAAEPERSRARLALAEAIRIILRNGLDLLGIGAPESM